MPKLTSPDPKRRVKPMGGARNTVPLEPPPTPPRITAAGVWRPASPGWGDRPGERDTRPLPKNTRTPGGGVRAAAPAGEQRAPQRRTA